MLPLTTHCHKGSREHEQYVLKEFLAYRIYNLLTDKSLRVRLLQMTYHDTSRPRSKPFVRYGFFTEHFDSLAARHDAEVWKPERFDVTTADPMEIGTLDLFQYMIGNTDFSVIYGHNIAYIRDRSGLTTPVPYDFDFSGLVHARYATTDPALPISSVRQRLFRGFCRPVTERDTALPHFQRRENRILGLTSRIPGLNDQSADKTTDYLQSLFSILSDRSGTPPQMIQECRQSIFDQAQQLGSRWSR